MKYSEETISASMDLWRLVNETKNNIKNAKGKDKVLKSLNDVPAALDLLLETMGIAQPEPIQNEDDKKEIKSLTKQLDKLKNTVTEQDKIIQVASIDNATLESKIKKLEKKPKDKTKDLQHEIIELQQKIKTIENEKKKPDTKNEKLIKDLLIERDKGLDTIKELKAKLGKVQPIVPLQPHTNKFSGAYMPATPLAKKRIQRVPTPRRAGSLESIRNNLRRGN